MSLYPSRDDPSPLHSYAQAHRSALEALPNTTPDDVNSGALLVPAFLPSMPTTAMSHLQAMLSNPEEEIFTRVFQFNFFPVHFFEELLDVTVHLPGSYPYVVWDGGVIVKSVEGGAKESLWMQYRPKNRRLVVVAGRVGSVNATLPPHLLLQYAITVITNFANWFFSSFLFFSFLFFSFLFFSFLFFSFVFLLHLTVLFLQQIPTIHIFDDGLPARSLSSLFGIFEE